MNFAFCVPLKLCAQCLPFVSVTSTLGAGPWSHCETEESAHDSRGREGQLAEDL